MSGFRLVWVRECTRFHVYPQKQIPFLALIRKVGGFSEFFFPARGAYSNIPLRSSVEIVRDFAMGEAVAEHPRDSLKFIEGGTAIESALRAQVTS